MTYGHPFMGNAVAQNKAHRADEVWKDMGSGVHRRADGVEIRRNASGRPWKWLAYTADGAVWRGERFVVGGHSLTLAKYDVYREERVTERRQKEGGAAG
ncbi:hypothetical protein ACFC1T_09160 [Kitasatospora sp. NPDC056076]|uniref:hypothetical protein n=1 Tax=Kitasatospora sp. NPDC056076 TaxID=3345703 RepID=UPI0035E18E8F